MMIIRNRKNDTKILLPPAEESKQDTRKGQEKKVNSCTTRLLGDKKSNSHWKKFQKLFFSNFFVLRIDDQEAC